MKSHDFGQFLYNSSTFEEKKLVELENGVEGLVRLSSLRDDFYNYIENEFALIGRRKGKTFQIGDEVRVKLIEANMELRQLTFEIVEGVTEKNLIAYIEFNENS